MKPSGGVSPLTRSLLVAALLHGGLLGIVAHFRAPVLPPAPPQEPLVWVDAPPEPAEPSLAAPAESEPSTDQEPVAALAPRGHAGPVEPGTEASTEAEGEPGPEEPGQGNPAGQAIESDRPRLSLDQLGIGNSQMFWDKEIPKPESKHVRVEKRLRHALATGIAQQDQKRGLGPEGPVISRLELETRSGPTPPRSSARFRVVTDRRGKIVSLTVLNASGDRKRWNEVARRTLAALANTELRNKSPHGVTFDIRVVSRITLPSGADPGFNLSAGGLPITKGEGSRSAGIDILPMDGEVFATEMPETADGDLPGIQTGRVGGGQGDLSDIGAVAQRMVHAFVERLWANEPPPEAADAGAPN